MIMITEDELTVKRSLRSLPLMIITVLITEDELRYL